MQTLETSVQLVSALRRQSKHHEVVTVCQRMLGAVEQEFGPDAKIGLLLACNLGTALRDCAEADGLEEKEDYAMAEVAYPTLFCHVAMLPLPLCASAYTNLPMPR